MWAGIKKYLNSGMTTPLDTLIGNVQSVVDSIKTTLTDGKVPVKKTTQTGFISASAPVSLKEDTSWDVCTSSSYNSTYYMDVTISAVSDINKCIVKAIAINSTTSSFDGSFELPAKLVSTTKLRIYVSVNKPSIATYAMQWMVEEFY